MVMKVKQKSMNIRRTFPEALWKVSGVVCKRSRDLQPELRLPVCAHGEQIDDAIEHDTHCHDGSHRNIVPPESQYQVQGRNLEWDQNSFVQLRTPLAPPPVTHSSRLTKKFHPAINPYASSTHLLPMRTHPPTTGIKTLISAMQLFASASIAQYPAKAMNKLPGPPSTRPQPMDTNSAVPIDPPIAIHWMWRFDSRRCSPSVTEIAEPSRRAGGSKATCFSSGSALSLGAMVSRILNQLMVVQRLGTHYGTGTVDGTPRLSPGMLADPARDLQATCQQRRNPISPAAVELCRALRCIPRGLGKGDRLGALAGGSLAQGYSKAGHQPMLREAAGCGATAFWCG